MQARRQAEASFPISNQAGAQIPTSTGAVMSIDLMLKAIRDR